MTRILMVKALQSLRPIDEQGEKVLRSLAQGEVIAVEVVKERNIKHHRLLFCMLQIILENQEFYHSIEDLLAVAKLRTGHCETILTRDGEVKIPKSISFAAMDQIAFDSFYEKVVQWVILEVIPGLRRKDLDQEVEAQLMAFGDGNAI